MKNAYMYHLAQILPQGVLLYGGKEITIPALWPIHKQASVSSSKQTGLFWKATGQMVSLQMLPVEFQSVNHIYSDHLKN